MTLKKMPFALPISCVEILRNSFEEATHELWFFFKDFKLLVDKNSLEPFQTRDLSLKRSVSVGVFGGCRIYAGEVDLDDVPLGAYWEDLRLIYGKMSDTLLALAGKAIQLITWDRTHQFCGQCGCKTIEKSEERAKECPSCKLLFFPKISPVIMALIKKTNEILLVQGINFRAPYYSALAGFVEPGETLEHCLEREVFEEVGLEVENIEYFASQSWPFPDSLMIAFTCDWKNGEIRTDPKELVDAKWFKTSDLPLLPPEYSLSRILIEAISGRIKS